MGVKQQWQETDHSSAFRTGVENEWSYTSSSPIHLHNRDKDKLRIQAALIFG